MVLRGAEDQRFFALVDLVHEQLHAVSFPLFDLYDLVEVGFRVALPRFNFALHDLVIRRVHILIQGRGDLLYPERREETVIDAFPKRIDVDRVGKADPKRELASFVLFVSNKPGLKIVAQDGTPLPPEHLISSVNLKVEVRGTEVGDTFRLLGIRKLEDLPLL